MTEEEILKELEQIKAQVKAKPENKDKSEDEIDEIMIKGFIDAQERGEMSEEDLEALVNALGYEFEEGEEEAEGVSKEEAEDLRTIEPGESKEEFKEKIEEVKKPDSEDEEEERKKASELWKMDFSKRK